VSSRDRLEVRIQHTGEREQIVSLILTWFKKCRCRVTPKTDGAALAKGFGVSSGTLI
jgi:hypothetical protein